MVKLSLNIEHHKGEYALMNFLDQLNVTFFHDMVIRRSRVEICYSIRPSGNWSWKWFLMRSGLESPT